MSVAKHFPGLGRVAGNTDFTANVVDTVTTANDPYLNSFRAAVGAGVPMVMVALANYAKIDPTELAVFSPTVMRLLRNGLGFNGVIVSDDLGQATAVQSVAEPNRANGFLAAGGDLVTSQSLPGRADGGRGARQGVGGRRLPRHRERRGAAGPGRQEGGRAAAVLT